MKTSDVLPQNTSPVDPSDQEDRRRRRRRRWWFLIGFGLSGMVLALPLLFYAQSQHALIHIYLPILSRQLGVHVQAAGGSVCLNGRIHLTDFTLAGIDGEPAVQVKQIDLKIRPLTVLGNAFPTIDELLFVNPRLRIQVDLKGKTNMGYTHATNRRKISEALKNNQRTASSLQPFPLVRLGRLDIKNLTLDYANAAGLNLTIDKLDLTAANMVPGNTGTFNLTLACLMERPNEGVRQEGTLKAEGNLAQKPGGQALDWTSSLDLAIKSRLPNLPTTQSITLKSNLKGSVTAGGQWDQTFQIEATTPRGPAGLCQGNLVWDNVRPMHSASLRIQEIGPEVLNPLLTLLGKVQIVDARLDVDCRIGEDANGIHFDSRASADRVSVRLDKDSTLTKPVTITLIQKGTYNPGKREVRWDAFDLAMNPASRKAEGGTDRIQIEGLCRFGKPMDLNLKVRVVSLTADHYQDYLDQIGLTNSQGKSEPTPKAEPPTKETPSPNAENDKEIPSNNYDLIQADIAIDQIRYHKATLDHVAAKLSSKNGVLDLRIERGKLCDGALTLHLQTDMTRRESRYLWDATLNGSDVAALMSLQHETTSTAVVQTEAVQIHEEPRGRISNLLQAIQSRAENVVADITDMAGALKPRPRKLTGKASVTSHGTGQGSGQNLLRTLESETKFEIKNGEIQGFFVLDALAIATRIDTFRTLDFDRSSGVMRTQGGKAVFKEVGASGPLEKVKLTGDYDLVDHSYNLALQPAIGVRYLDKITNNPFLPHLVRDSQGYLTFPLELSVRCDSAGRRKVMVYPKLPQGLGTLGGKVGEAARDAVGGTIEKSTDVIKESGGAIKKSGKWIGKSIGKELDKAGNPWSGEKKKGEGK